MTSSIPPKEGLFDFNVLPNFEIKEEINLRGKNIDKITNDLFNLCAHGMKQNLRLESKQKFNAIVKDFVTQKNDVVDIGLVA